MPNYIEWRMMAEGQYVVGVEPCTNGFGRDEVRAKGDLAVLGSGNSRTYRTRLQIIDSEQAEQLRQRSRRATMSSQPRRE